VLSAALLCASLGVQTVCAAGPDDIYLQAYNLIQEGEEYSKAGRTDLSRERFEEARKNLVKLQKSYPSYNTKAVEIRMEYVNEKLGKRTEGTNTPPTVAEPVPSQAGGGKPTAPPAQSVPKATSPTPTPAAPVKDESKNLKDRVSLLEADNAMLQAKLQEALSARPAAIDPQQLAKAEDQIKQLEKEKELLRSSLAQAEAKKPQAAEAAMTDQVKGELEATRKKLTETVATVASLSQEKQALQTQLETERAAKGKAEAETKPETTKPAKSENAQIKDLEKERDGLLKKLNDANKELYDVKARGQAAQFENLTNQLGNLRARLEVFESRKVPYTAEELALLNKSVPKLDASVDSKTAKKPIRELPAGAADYIRKAERAFAAHKFDEAEENYKKVLEMDPGNATTLANLAAIQLEMDKLSEAETNLKKAAAANPEDAYTLSLMGMLKFRQEKYDEALENLSRSAQLDPKNAETQNYLGITLSQKGQREAAETALRKAIMLQPTYAGAHHNLAVIYASEKPPALELAKYHYNKALGLGQPANPDLEKMLNLATVR